MADALTMRFRHWPPSSLGLWACLRHLLQGVSSENTPWLAVVAKGLALLGIWQEEVTEAHITQVKAVVSQFTPLTIKHVTARFND